MIRSLLLGAVAAFQVENIILDQQLGERSFNDRYVQECFRVSPLSGARDLSVIKSLCFFINGGASLRWSFGPLSIRGSKESTTILTTHPSLYFYLRWFTYSFLHGGFSHFFINFLFQIALGLFIEFEHKVKILI